MIVHDTNLDGAIERIAAYLNYPVDALHEFAANDPYTKMGWDNGEGDAPVGSLFSVEGQVLYALVRAMQPTAVLELGTNVGASTTHLAGGVTANGSGSVVTIESNLQLSGTWRAGQLIPAAVKQAVQMVNAEGVGFITGLKDNAFAFIFEDMLHGPAEVETVWTQAIRVCQPGGLIVSHDAAHYIVGLGVQQGIRAALNAAGYADQTPLVLRIAPGDTGLAIWKKPGVYTPPAEEQEPEWQTTEKPASETAAAKPAPSRRKTRSASKSPRG
jgi:predicted O-methyltransferase YrrM